MALAVRGEMLIWLILTRPGSSRSPSPLRRDRGHRPWLIRPCRSPSVCSSGVTTGWAVPDGRGRAVLTTAARRRMSRAMPIRSPTCCGVLPERGLVLEVASGSGEHVLHFARTFPDCLAAERSRAGGAALDRGLARRGGLSNLLPPVRSTRGRDMAGRPGRRDPGINMVHISPWAATAGLLRGAGRLLAAGAPLYLYGAYLQAGVETAPSNLAFDESLKARDPEWGVRDLEDGRRRSRDARPRARSVVPMPANNLSVVFGSPSPVRQVSVVPFRRFRPRRHRTLPPPAAFPRRGEARQAQEQQRPAGRTPSRRSRRSASGRRASPGTARPRARPRPPPRSRGSGARARGSISARHSQTSVALAAWPLGKASESDRREMALRFGAHRPVQPFCSLDQQPAGQGDPGQQAPPRHSRRTAGYRAEAGGEQKDPPPPSSLSQRAASASPDDRRHSEDQQAAVELHRAEQQHHRPGERQPDQGERHSPAHPAYRSSRARRIGFDAVAREPPFEHPAAVAGVGDEADPAADHLALLDPAARRRW